MMLLLATSYAEAKTQKKEFKVNGSCSLCEKRIVSTARSVSGTVVATWNKRTKVMCLLYDDKKTSPETVMQALAKAGHDAGNFKASTQAYRALPSCCWYRSTKVH